MALIEEEIKRAIEENKEVFDFFEKYDKASDKEKAKLLKNLKFKKEIKND